MQRHIHLERHYNHPPERVWRALTDPEIIKRWMQMDNNFKAEVGHAFELRDVSGNWDGVLNCVVTQVNPPHHLAYSFIGGFMKHETLVSITLEATATGTKLQLAHTGFTNIPEIALSFIIGMGWRRMFKRLQNEIETLKIHNQEKEASHD